VFIKLGIAIAIAIAVEIELEIAAIGEDLNNDPDCWDSRMLDGTLWMHLQRFGALTHSSRLPEVGSVVTLQQGLS